MLYERIVFMKDYDSKLFSIDDVVKELREDLRTWPKGDVNGFTRNNAEDAANAICEDCKSYGLNVHFYVEEYEVEV